MSIPTMKNHDLALLKERDKAKRLTAAIVFSVFCSAVVAQEPASRSDSIEDEVLEGEALPSNMVNPRDTKDGPDLDALAEELINPLSDLWFLAIQNDTTTYGGDLDDGNTQTFNNLKIQPVMSIPLNEEYNVVVRPVIQYLSYDFPRLNLIDTNPPITEDSFEVDFNRKNGFGDTLFLASVGPSDVKGKFLLAGGATFILPTASDEELKILTANEWAVGPSLTGIYIGDEWILGAFAQHWWGVGDRNQKFRINIPSNGQDLTVDVDGDDLNLSDIQYIVRYRYSQQTNIGAAPNITINWNQSGSDRFTVPVGIGFDTMDMFGPLPVKWGAELQYYVNQPDNFGPEWNLRVFFVPIVPNPLKN
jgi:hypothetical protein